MQETVLHKTCSRCEQDKLFDNFYTGYTFCKRCHKKGRTAYRICIDCGKTGRTDRQAKADYRCRPCGTRHGILKSFQDPVKRAVWVANIQVRASAMNKKIRNRRGAAGSSNPHWKGGVTEADEKARWSHKARKWRKEVLKRDGFSCQLCGCHEKKLLQAHHKQRWADHMELRFDQNNGVTLCRDCHLNIVHQGKWSNVPLNFWV